MFAAILALAVSFTGADAAPLVCDEVDTIAVCHVADGAELVFFFDYVQSEWTCLDHRWIGSDMVPGREGEHFTLAWRDEGDSCWRVMRTRRWLETWEPTSPLAETHNKPWHARLCAPGLKQPIK